MSHARFLSQVFIGLMLVACLTGGQFGHALADAADPGRPMLSEDLRFQLREAARDPGLEPWQREVMSTLSLDGEWSELLAQTRAYAGAIYDPLRARLVIFGGYDGSYHNDTWTLALDGAPAWVRLTPSGTPPPARSRHAAIYDPVRDRMVIFGGSDGSTRRNDTWALSLAGTPAWSELTPSGAPPVARASHAAIYDPVRDRMVIFGGWTGGYRNDAWALSLGETPAWTDLAPEGTRPAGRYGHSATYDPVRDRVVIFGGFDGSIRRNDTWALSLAGAPAWTMLAPSGATPTGRYLHTAVYDPARDRLVVFGGSDGSLRNDTWELTLGDTPAWSQLPVSGSLPLERCGHAAIYDPVRDRMVIYGGSGEIYLSDLWALSLGGAPAWSDLAPSGPLAPGLAYGATIYDPARDRMVIFGGSNGLARGNDTWSLSLGGTPAWTRLTPAGTPPSAREHHTAIYDAVRDRMLIFGGYDGAYRNDTWALSLGAAPAWGRLVPPGPEPPERGYHTAIYDPVRDQMVIFGGVTTGGTYLQDTWTLSFAGTPAWTELDPPPLWPIWRYGHSAIYDPVRDRMVIFGGFDGVIRRNDAWALSLGDSPVWTQLTLSGLRPAAREGHSAVYDPARDRMVMFGGYDGNYYNDAWALSLAGTPAWSHLAPSGAPPPGRFDHAAIYDPVRDRLVIYGGQNGTILADLRALTWSALTSVGGAQTSMPPPSRLALHPASPNPFSASATIRYDIRGSGSRVTLGIYDVDGRRVRMLVDREAGAGTHEVVWDGRDSRGRAARPGIYFCRLEANGARETRKIVLSR